MSRSKEELLSMTPAEYRRAGMDPGVRREAGADPAHHWRRVAGQKREAAAEADGHERDWLLAQAAGYDAVADIEGKISLNMAVGTGPGGETHYPMEGACGFAWVNTPGNRRFGRWARQQDGWRPDSYLGGVTYWVGHFNQSYERKGAWAEAAARALQERGHSASAGSRLD